MYLHQELVADRMKTLHREAAEYRMVTRAERVRRAREDVRRAAERLARVLG